MLAARLTSGNPLIRSRRVLDTPRRPLVDEKLADQLLGRAQAEGAELLCPAELPPWPTRFGGECPVPRGLWRLAW